MHESRPWRAIIATSVEMPCAAWRLTTRCCMLKSRSITTLAGMTTSAMIWPLSRMERSFLFSSVSAAYLPGWGGIGLGWLWLGLSLG